MTVYINGVEQRNPGVCEDSGTHTIEVSKAWEAVLFHKPFPSPPAVVVTLQGVAGGKKSGHTNVTTTGFDISAEAIGDCDWLAMEKGE